MRALVGLAQKGQSVMPFHITDRIFSDEDKAREHLEAQRWPAGPHCPHCGEAEQVTKLEGKKHRPGVYQCNSCRQQFTVTVGTVLERSKIPLHKWLLATYLLSASKKGMSAHQLHRMLGVTYKTAWFMAHRIREAMREPASAHGGHNKVVEADETFVGGKAKNRKSSAPIPPKEPVVSLVERDGKVRSFHAPDVTAATLRPILSAHIDRQSYLMTDESGTYKTIGREFDGHGTVNHSFEEYVRGSFWHTNTCENYFSILKRGIFDVYHHVRQQHLKRYVGEFDFLYSSRDAADSARVNAALRGIEGKRLTYRRIDV
jgi:transposase-like protein